MVNQKPEVGRRSVARFNLTSDHKRTFGKIIILLNITKFDIPVGFEGTNPQVNEWIIELLSEKLISQTNGPDGYRYTLTTYGTSYLQELGKRNLEFIRVYEVYKHVDTQIGEFAMAGFFETGGHQDSQEWANYVRDQRWWDLRMAVAYYKGLEPVDTAFLLFAFDNDCPLTHFESAEQLFEAVQFEQLWGQMEEIINSQPLWEELCGTRRYDPDKPFTDEEIAKARQTIETILAQGANLLKDLLEQEAQIREEEAQQPQGNFPDDVENDEEVETVTTVTYETEETYEYMDNILPYYYDPWYVSPLWEVPLVLGVTAVGLAIILD